MYIPYWAMTLDELLPLTLGAIDNQGDRGAVIDKIMELKLAAIKRSPKNGVSEESLSVDTPVPFCIHKLWFDLHCDMRATHRDIAGQPQSNATWALEVANGNPVQPGDMMRGVAPRFMPAKDVRGDEEKIRLSKSVLGIGRAMDGLGSKLRDPRFDCLLRPGPFAPNEHGEVSKDLDALLAEWLGDAEPDSHS